MTENLPTKKTDRLPELNSEKGIYFDIALYEHSYRMANLFSQSTMVPPDFQKNKANCMIAINMSVRLKLDPFMVMQDMYMIHGRPAMSAKMSIALFNRSEEFEPITYDTKGEGVSSACRATAKHIKTGIIAKGPWVTWEMVEKEGWSKKTGSKWKTMPDVMFRYRAAAFFIRLHAPQLLLGMITIEEAKDMNENDIMDIKIEDYKEINMPDEEPSSEPAKSSKEVDESFMTQEEKQEIINEEVETSQASPGF